MNPDTHSDLWYKQGGVMLAVLIATLVSTSLASAAWQVQQEINSTGLKTRCYLQSETQTLSDGYQETQALIKIGPDRVRVTTGAPIDVSFSDLGLQVDQQAFIPIDEVHAEQSVQFISDFTTIIKQFIKGRQVRIHLRFWPTWPAKGVQLATFSLLGFSAAHKDITQLKNCWTLENKP